MEASNTIRLTLVGAAVLEQLPALGDRS